MKSIEGTKWLRRARPLLGTLVDIGILDGGARSEDRIRSAFNALCEDALTKIVAMAGEASHPLLSRHGAQAWLH